MAALPEPVQVLPDRIFATVGGKMFRTQEDLKKHAQAVLHKYPVGAFADEPDRFFLLQLIARHPRAKHKISRGIVAFQKRMNDYRDAIAAPGWWIIRVDGSEAAFSIHACLRDRPPGEDDLFLEDVRVACREAVDPVVYDFKRNAFDAAPMVKCEETGARITFSEAHVDHAGEWPFVRIVDEWLHDLGEYFWSVSLNEPENGSGVRFDNVEITEDFREFHDTRAKLRIVHKSINMAAGSGGYRLTFKPPPRPDEKIVA